MTDKWQCVKCKQTKEQSVTTKTLDNGKVTISPLDVHLVMCHYHIMRNLSEGNYINENSINESGARDLNTYKAV